MRNVVGGLGAPARVAAAACAALALAVGAASCGGDEEEETTAPATASVTPADAAVWGEAVVRPEGDQQEAVDGALSKLLNTDDPGGFLVEQLDGELGSGNPPVSYAEDIEPWLGEQVGFFVNTFEDEPDGAVMAEVTDQGEAEALIERLRDTAESPVRDRSYNGVDYESGTDGEDAVGFVEDFLVVGTENGLRQVIDASQGSALGDDGEFQDQLATAPDNSIATLYADVPTVLDRLVDVGEITAQQRSDLDQQIGAAAEQPAIASLAATSESLALQVAAGASQFSIPRESPFLSEFPADAWLAFGLADYGDSVREALDQGGGAAGLGSFDAFSQSVVGLDIEELTGWISDIGAFASGTSVFGLGGALVLETTDESASANAIDAIAQALGRNPSVAIEPLSGAEAGFTLSIRDAPVQVVVEQRDGRVVAGLGEESVDEALEPADRLGESEGFEAASEALGSDNDPLLYVDVEPILELFESTGEAQDTDYQSAKPYLDHLDYLVYGGRREDDEDIVSFVLGLR